MLARGARAARGPRTGRLDHARPAQVALPALRVRLPARPRGESLRNAFLITPDYLREAIALEGEMNFSDLGMQLSRSSRAFKVWVSIQYFGLDAFRRAIERTLDLAGRAAAHRGERQARAAAQPSLGVVCFRRVFEEATRRCSTRGSSRRSRRAASGSSPRRGSRPLRDPDVRHEPHHAQEDVDRVLDFLERPT